MTASDSNWKESLYRGLPALAVACIAMLLVGYGKYILAPSLPARYESELESLRSQYNSGVESTRRLLEIGSSIDLCYSRLESMGVARDAWERFQFTQDYVRQLKERAPTVESPEDGDELKVQLSKFVDMQERMLARLSAPESPYAKQANLLAAKQLLSSDYQPVVAQSVRQGLEAVLKENGTDDELRLTLAQLAFEDAWWWAQRSGAFPPEPARLQTVSDYLRDLPLTEPEAAQLHLEWLAQTDAERAQQAAADMLQEIAEGRSLNDWLANAIVAHAIGGDWGNVRSLLSQKFALADPEEQLQLRKSVSKSCLRLLFSKLATDIADWRVQVEQGLRLAIELYPTAFEIHAFDWELARRHAGLESPLPEDLVEAIMISESSQRYLVLAMSNALRQLPNKATPYMQLAKQSDPFTVSRLANLVLWQNSTADASGSNDGEPDPAATAGVAQATASAEQAANRRAEVARLKPLLEDAVEEDDAVGWLALGQLQLSAGELAAAKESLKKAEQVLGPSDLISAMLKMVESQQILSGSLPEESSAP
ncbi:MAG: hypothetical protein NXI32_25695 [bacterium]|nr:hypothetical protein [bacterium]